MRFLIVPLCAWTLIIDAESSLSTRAIDLGQKATSRTQQRRVISRDFAKLISELRTHGASVKRSNESVSQTFFSSKGRIIYVNDESVWVYIYSTTKTAQNDARKISPDGMTIGTSKPSWLGTPHFFRRPRLILLYLGDDSSVLDLIKKTVGEQFAGG